MPAAHGGDAVLEIVETVSGRLGGIHGHRDRQDDYRPARRDGALHGGLDRIRVLGVGDARVAGRRRRRLQIGDSRMGEHTGGHAAHAIDFVAHGTPQGRKAAHDAGLRARAPDDEDKTHDGDGRSVAVSPMCARRCADFTCA